MQYRAAIIAGLQATGLFAAGLLVPFLGQIAVLFVPVPLVSASLLYGRKTGAAAAGMAAALVAILGGGQVPVLLLFLSLLLMALGLVEGMVRGLRPESSIILGGVLPLIFLALAAAPLIVRSAKDPFLMAEELLRRSLSDAQQLYASMGLAEVARSITEVSDSVVFYAVRLIPGILLSTSLMQSATCFGLAKASVHRRRPGSAVAAGPSFALWHAPDPWVWGLIATLGMIAVPNVSVRLVGMNLGFVFLLVYTSQGAAVIEFTLRRLRIPLLLRSVLLALLLALPTIVAVIALGIVDIWGDFRKVRAAAPRS